MFVDEHLTQESYNLGIEDLCLIFDNITSNNKLKVDTNSSFPMLQDIGLVEQDQEQLSPNQLFVIPQDQQVIPTPKSSIYQTRYKTPKEVLKPKGKVGRTPKKKRLTRKMNEEIKEGLQSTLEDKLNLRRVSHSPCSQ